MSRRGKESRLNNGGVSRHDSSSLHVVGCVPTHKEKPGNDRLTQFLMAQKENFDDEDYGVVDEASDLKAENQRQVEEMLQKAKDVLCKKREESTVQKEEAAVPRNKPDRRANALEMLHKMEWLRNQSDHNELGSRANRSADEKHTVVSLQNKNKEDAEYFCGTKSNKIKNKKKNRPEIVINLEELERPLLEAAAAQQKHNNNNNKVSKQKASVSPPPYAPPAVTCWQQKSGADLFPEVQTRTLTIYGTNNTEDDELLKLAIEESLRTHEAEKNRFIDLTEPDRFDRLQSRTSNNAGVMQFPVPAPIEDEVWDDDDVAQKPVILESIPPTAVDGEAHKKKGKESRTTKRSQSVSVERFQEVAVPVPSCSYDTSECLGNTDTVWDDDREPTAERVPQRQHRNTTSRQPTDDERQPQKQHDNRSASPRQPMDVVDDNRNTSTRQCHESRDDNRSDLSRQPTDVGTQRNTSTRQRHESRDAYDNRSADVGTQRHADNNRNTSTRQHHETRDTYDNRSALSRQPMDVGTQRRADDNRNTSTRQHHETRDPQRQCVDTYASTNRQRRVDAYDKRSASSRQHHERQRDHVDTYDNRQSMDVGHHVVETQRHADRHASSRQHHVDNYNRNVSSRQSEDAVETRNPQRHVDTYDNRQPTEVETQRHADRHASSRQHHVDNYNRNALSRQSEDAVETRSSHAYDNRQPTEVETQRHASSRQHHVVETRNPQPSEVGLHVVETQTSRHQSSKVPRSRLLECGDDEVWEMDGVSATPRQQQRRHVDQVWEFDSATTTPRQEVEQHRRLVESCVSLPQEYLPKWPAQTEEDLRVTSRGSEDSGVCVTHDDNDNADVSVEQFFKFEPVSSSVPHVSFDPMSVLHGSDQAAAHMKFEPMSVPDMNFDPMKYDLGFDPMSVLQAGVQMPMDPRVMSVDPMQLQQPLKGNLQEMLGALVQDQQQHLLYMSRLVQMMSMNQTDPNLVPSLLNPVPSAINNLLQRNAMLHPALMGMGPMFDPNAVQLPPTLQMPIPNVPQPSPAAMMMNHPMGVRPAFTMDHVPRPSQPPAVDVQNMMQQMMRPAPPGDRLVVGKGRGRIITN